MPTQIHGKVCLGIGGAQAATKLALVNDEQSGVQGHLVAGYPDQDGHPAVIVGAGPTAPCRRQDLLIGSTYSDGIEGEIHAASADVHHRLHRVDFRTIDDVCGPELLGELQFVVFQVHGDYRVGFQDGGHSDGRKAHASHTKHGHRVTGPHLGRVHHRTGPGENRTADNGANVDGVIFGDGYHQLAANQNILSPGVHAPMYRLFTVGNSGVLRRRPASYRRAGHPGDDGMVAFFQVRDVRTHVGDDACAFVSQDHRPRSVGVVHLVELGMADAAGKELDQYLVRSGVGYLQLVHNESLPIAYIDSSFRPHGISLSNENIVV